MPFLTPTTISQVFGNGDPSIYVPGGAPNTDKVNQFDGFPLKQELLITENGLPVNRHEMNGAFNLAFQHILWHQVGGQYIFDTAISAVGGYNNNAILFNPTNKRMVISLHDNNTANYIANQTLINGTDWQYLDQYIPTMSTTQSGIGMLATASQAQGLTSTNLISALGLSQAFQGVNQNLSGIASNPFQNFPGGLKFKFGVASTDSSGMLNVTFPSAFPGGFFYAIAVYRNAAPTSLSYTLLNLSLTALQFGVTFPNNTPAVGASSYWFAIGY